MNTYDPIASALGISPVDFSFSHIPEDSGHTRIPGPNKPGYTLSEETKQKMRKPKNIPSHRLGCSLSEETKAKLRKPNTVEHNKKISKAKQKLIADGNFISPSEGGHQEKTIQKITDSLRKYNSIIKTCNVCGKEGRGSGMNRWHFQNCSIPKSD